MNRPLPKLVAGRQPLHALSLSLTIAAALLATLVASEASAQAIERNLPPAPVAVAPRIVAPNAVPSAQDATPIGPALSAIVLLGPTDTPLTASAAGVDLSRIPRLARQDAAFSRFLGQPISRRLIARIEAEIAHRYRAKGYPFVSVSTPVQEITSGVVQVRVVEFHLGAKAVTPPSTSDAAYIESRVRVQPGEAIDTDQLAQDLDWLNRLPFRRTEAVFTPGADVGATNLQLQTTESKPWSVYAGYANSGSPLTGWDRYFAGAQAVLPGLHDATVSYQFTGSGDALFGDGRVFGGAADPSYLSDAARIIIPAQPRQAIEASFSYVKSNEAIPSQPGLATRQTTYEATLDYRSALSNLWRSLPGEVAFGVELKRQDTETLFAGAEIQSAAFDVFQITAAYAEQENDAFGSTVGELTLHLSPGSVASANTNAAFAVASNGVSDLATYAYVSGDVTRITHLPMALFGASGWGLVNSLIGQYSAIPLPLTEQFGLGGAGLVRGYTLDDGAFDTGVISRNELRTPAIPLLARIGGPSDRLSPFAFVDAAFGKDQRTGVTASPVSVGLGADYQMGTHLAASIDGAWALNSAGLTRDGDVRLETRITVTF
jgi:hemolysin activation/secretion protein